MKLYPQSYIRKHITNTLDKCETILERFRHRKATDKEAQAAWVLLSDIVYSRAKTHYKQKQPYGVSVHGRERYWYETGHAVEGKYISHTARMMQLYQFMRDNMHRSIGWCIVTYRLRFAEFEMRRELTALGISLKSFDTEEDVPSPFSSSDNFIRFAIEIRKLKRLYFEYYQNEPNHKEIIEYWRSLKDASEQRTTTFARKYAHYVTVFESVNGVTI